jgi:hypothetical protein
MAGFSASASRYARDFPAMAEMSDLGAQVVRDIRAAAGLWRWRGG